MKIFNIICYWTDIEKGINHYNPDWMFLRIGDSYEEVYAWAKENYRKYYFKPNIPMISDKVSETNLKYNFSVKEIDSISILDLSEIEYKANLKLVSKIEIKKVEIPLE